MSDPTFEELTKMHGEDVSDVKPIHNESSGGFYIHAPGDYQGLVSKMSITYKDVEGKKCEKNKPGAKPAFGGLKIIIVKDPEKTLIDGSLNFSKEDDFGRLSYNIYLSLDPEKQWQSVKLLADFRFNNLKDADVISGKKNEEDVNLANLPLYYGTPIKFEVVVGKKADSRFIQGIEILDHQTLTKELLTKRKAVADSINAKFDARIAEIQAERKAKKDKDGPSGPAEESSAVDANTFVDGLGIGDGASSPQSPNDDSNRTTDDLPF